MNPKARHPEAYGPELLRCLAGTLVLDEKTKAIYLSWWRADFPFSLDRLANPKLPSWNWDFILAAIWFHTAPLAAWDGFWYPLLRYQLGRESPPAGREMLGLWDGSELKSSTYGSFRYGSVALIERLTARKYAANPLAPQVIELCRAYRATACAIEALGATPWPDPVGHRGSARQWYDGPMVSPVGERSTPAHFFQNDMGPILGWGAGIPPHVSLREDWGAAESHVSLPLPARAACSRAIPGDFDWGWYSDAMKGIRVRGALLWKWWGSGDELVKLTAAPGPRGNGNTPKVFWSLQSKGSNLFGFPWVGGRADQTRGDCVVTDSMVSAEGNAGRASFASLPERKADLTLSLTGEGFRVVA